MSKGNSSQKLKKVKWVPDAMLRQVKSFLSEDSPSKIQSKPVDHLQSKPSLMSYSTRMGFHDAPPGFEGKGYSDTLKLACIPRVKWNCPPMFILNSDWHVVAGEQSSERETQKYREMRVLEAFYPRASSIPPSPLVSPDLDKCGYDDSETSLVPVTPIEDEDAIPCCNSAATSQDVVAVNSVQHSIPVVSKPTVDERYVRVSAGKNADIVAAASAAFTAILKSIEKGSMVDTDLLIKILSDPKMVKALSNVFGSSAAKKATPIEQRPSMIDTDLLIKILSDPKMVEALSNIFGSSTAAKVTPVEPKAVAASAPLPTKSCHVPVSSLDENSNLYNTVQHKLLPVSDTLLTSQPIQVPKLPMPSAKPHIFTSLQRADGKSNQFSKYLETSSHIPSISVPESQVQSHSKPSVESHATLSKLDDVNLLQAATSSSLGSKMAVTSTLCSQIQGRNDSEKPVDDRSELPRRVTPDSSSHVNGSNAPPLNLFTQPDRYSLQIPVNYLESSQLSVMSSEALPPKPEGLFPNMVSSAKQENQNLPQDSFFGISLQSPSAPPDKLPLSPFPSISTPAVKDENYFKNLIRLHGTGRQETQEKYTPQYESIVSELRGVSGQVDVRAKTRKPCKYFNGSKGCRRGSRCHFEHVSLLKRDGNFPDVDRPKRFKFSGELTGRM